MARSKYFKPGIVNPNGRLKDGNPAYPYNIAHPANYNWTAPAVKLIDLTAEAFPYLLWLNTYLGHPPARQPAPGQPSDTDRLSWDVWENEGRGSRLSLALGNAVRNFIFGFPDSPDIWWQMWQYRMFVRDPVTFKTRIVTLQQDAEDNAHTGHIHTTILQAGAQRRFRERLAAHQVWAPASLRDLGRAEVEDLRLTRAEVYRFLDQEAGLND